MSSTDDDYFPDNQDMSDEDIAQEQANSTSIVLADHKTIEVIDQHKELQLDPDDLIVEEYELHEETEVPAAIEEHVVEENPILKKIAGSNFSDDERIALEFCVEELLTSSKTLSRELDDKIPLSWESVAQKMQDSGFDCTAMQDQKPLRREILSQDNAIYQRLLRKLKEQMDEQEAQRKLAIKIEAQKLQRMSIQYDDRDDDDDDISEFAGGDFIEEIVDDAHLDEKIKCDLCHVNVKRRDMFDHQSVHRNDAPYKCKECGKTFRKKYPLKLHRRVHTQEKPFSCEICGMLFKADGSLKRHMKRHLGEEEKKYQCEFCDTKWLSPYDLNAHRRTHTGEKPFLCHDCGVSFAKISNLNAHQRRHKNIRNYKCDECERAFMSSTELENHKVSHTGIKKYKCDLCGRSFGTNESLSRHKARHPGLLNLVHCPICNRRFRSDKGLQAHMNFGTCTEFKCPKCHLTFKSLNGLTAHHKRSKCMVDVDNDNDDAVIEEEEVDEPTQLLVVTDFMD